MKNMNFALQIIVEKMEVPSLSGCFMFVRIAVLKKVGGFDERYLCMQKI